MSIKFKHFVERHEITFPLLSFLSVYSFIRIKIVVISQIIKRIQTKRTKISVLIYLLLSDVVFAVPLYTNYKSQLVLISLDVPTQQHSEKRKRWNFLQQSNQISEVSADPTQFPKIYKIIKDSTQSWREEHR